MDPSKLIQKLENCASKEEASLASLDITDSEFVEYVIPVFLRAKWTKLHLCENNIGDVALRHLASALTAGNDTLTELDLGWNQITDMGMKHLAAIIKLSPLKELVLHSNEITDRGVAKLMPVVEGSSLQALDLCANVITDHGALTIANCLARTSLHSLDLSQNRISNIGARHLVIGMRRSHVTFLNLDETEVYSQKILHEIVRTEELIRTDFRHIVSMCSARAITRLGRSSPCRILPEEIVRKVAEMLYKLSDLQQV